MRSALRDLVRPKRIAAAVTLVAIPLALAILWRTMTPAREYRADDAYNTLAAGLVFGFVLVILSVVFATSVIAQEVEQKTIVYLLTRPVPRWRLLTVKFVAAVVAITAVAAAADCGTALALYGVSGLSGSHLGRDLLILPVGAAAYSALFLLVGTLLNRPLIYGLVFGFGWETLVPNLPGDFRKVSLMVYLRVLAPHASVQGDDTGMRQLLDMLSPQTISTATAWRVLTVVTAAALGAALLAFSIREYVPREDAE